MRNEEIRTIEGLMKKAESVAVTSLYEDGYPRTVNMSNIKYDGIKVVWFSTGLNSIKVKHYLKDCRSSVCYNVDGHNITLIGDMEVVDDADIKKSLWLEWFINYFTQGTEDPNYCILKFTTKRVAVWINDIFEEFEL